jgi:hypothetical protein
VFVTLSRDLVFQEVDIKMGMLIVIDITTY